MNNSLFNCYQKIYSILGDQSEPYESVELIEQYRQYWCPEKVNVILLAESHVFTSNYDRSFKLIVSKDDNEFLKDYPNSYAKFVYCLAYGEETLTKGDNHPAKADGTPQFWKILYSCINKVESNESFSPVLKSGTKSAPERIRNKIKLLLELKKQGIWLVDASIIALYNKGIKPSNDVFNEVIKTSWNHYTKHLILDANPNHVIIVGKGVAKNIESSLSSIVGNKNYTIIPQPQAHLPAEEHLSNFQKYCSICSSNQTN
ncbi:hypothetical protein OAJ80_00260 [Candidatus Thioglobus sp.]|nr:hypothetical protein [Candidatus Thioglobus sp.]